MSSISLSKRPLCDEEPGHESACEINVGGGERLLSIAGALGCLAISSRVDPLPRLLSLALSAGLFYRGLTGKCKLYDTIGYSTAYSQLHPNAVIRNKRGVHVIEAMTIQQPAQKLYATWRDFAGLPKYLQHVSSVEILDPRRLRWTIQSSVGELQWDAEIIEDKPNEIISWKTLGKADINSAGSVRFVPLSDLRGTELVINLRYEAASNKLASWFASMSSNPPEQIIREDLRRFKQLLEAGEIATTQGQPTGRRDLLSKFE